MRKSKKLTTAEKYHVYNRGVDKRLIFLDEHDWERFFQSMIFFNTVIPIGSLYEYRYKKDTEATSPLVYFITFSLRQNHFHFLIEQAVENGISEFMKRVLGGYTSYFNHKYKRSGSLFQGTFKSSHIDSNEYLLYVSAYINLNDEQNEFGGLTPTRYSGWAEYTTERNKNCFCTHKHFVLDQFSSFQDYKKFALDVLEEVKSNKARYKLLED